MKKVHGLARIFTDFLGLFSKIRANQRKSVELVLKGTNLRLLVRIPDTTDIASIARTIRALNNVNKVEIKEKY